MLWPLIVPLIVNVTSNPRLEKINHGNLFKDVGHVYSKAKDAHLIIPINLQELEDRRNSLDTIRRHVVNMDENQKRPTNDNSGNYLFNLKTRKSLAWMKMWTNQSITNGMDRLEDTLKSFEQNVSTIGDLGGRRRREVHYDRKKRQLVVGAIGLITGGIVAGIVNKYETDKLTHVLKQKQDVIVHALEESQVKIHQNAADLERLNQTVGSVVNAVWRMENNINNTNFVMLSLMTTYSVTETVHKSNQIMDALEDARSGSFNLNLCETTALKNGVTELQKQGLKHGRSLGIRSLFDLTHMAVSYLVDFIKRKLYLILHTPLVITNDYMILYEYRGSPVLLQNDTNLYIEVEVENQFLALTTDNLLYNEWTDASLKECQKIQKVYFCPGTVQYKRTRRSCLTGLYDGKSEMVQELCPLTITSQISRATQLNTSTYMLIETEPSELLIDCEEKKERFQIQGTYLLNLDPGCVASTPKLVVSRPKLEAEVTIDTKFLSNPLSFQNLISGNIHHFIEMAKISLGTVGKKVPVQTVTALSQMRDDMTQANTYSWFDWITSSEPGSLLNDILTIIFVIIIIYLFAKICPCLMRKIKKRRRNQNQPQPIKNPKANDKSGYDFRSLHLTQELRELNEQKEEFERFRLATAKLNLPKQRSRSGGDLELTTRNDPLLKTLISNPIPLATEEIGYESNQTDEEGIGREKFQDIHDYLNTKRVEKEKAKIANPDPNPENRGAHHNFAAMIGRLQRMTDEAEFECQTKFPFVSLMDNIPLEPELKGLPNPEEIDKFVTKIRKKRAQHLNGLSSTERMDLYHQENTMARRFIEGESIHGGRGTTDQEWSEQ